MTRAAEAFSRTLAEIGVDEREFDAEALGRRGALLAASELVWGRQVGTMLSSREVTELLDVTRQAVHDRTQRGSLLAVRGSDGGILYPAFQFGPNGRPLPGVPEATRTLAPVVETTYTIAAWFTSPEPELGGATPSDWLRGGGDPDAVVEQARREAARLAR
jgi:hypothetical protein